MLESDFDRQERELNAAHSEARDEAVQFGLPQVVTGAQVFAALGFPPLPTSEAKEDAKIACLAYGPWVWRLSEAIQTLDNFSLGIGEHGDWVRAERTRILALLREALVEAGEKHSQFIKVAI